MENELRLLWAAIILYVLAGSTAIIRVALGHAPGQRILHLLTGGLVLHALAIGMRWVRLDHGPFITLFEILSSNVWSLSFAFTLAYWRIPKIRATAVVVMPVLFVMMGWLMLAHPGEGHFPPTYQTPWLYIHIGFGKVFLGAVLVAVGLAGVILLRQRGRGIARLAQLPDNRRLDELAFRCLAIGLVFESLMLVAGAIWAQDAWGRYWAWDPLETWAFITWLVLAATLHARVTLRLAPPAHATMIMAVFALAFLTFFGVPFISAVPHQGAV